MADENNEDSRSRGTSLGFAEAGLCRILAVSSIFIAIIRPRAFEPPPQFFDMLARRR
jgi:hypothetical protein